MHANPTHTLHGSSLLIARRTIDALQDAEELGGPETLEEYTALMDFIIAECNTRKQNAAKHMPSAKPTPTVMINMDGGLIECVFADSPVNIVVIDLF